MHARQAGSSANATGDNHDEEENEAMLPAARAEYLAPWWASWLHGLPHLNLSLQPVSSAFHPRESDYQQVCLGPLTAAFPLPPTLSSKWD